MALNPVGNMSQYRTDNSLPKSNFISLSPQQAAMQQLEQQRILHMPNLTVKLTTAYFNILSCKQTG